METACECDIYLYVYVHMCVHWQNLHESLKGGFVLSQQALQPMAKMIFEYGVQHFYDFLSPTCPIIYVLLGYNAVYVTQIGRGSFIPAENGWKSI